MVVNSTKKNNKEPKILFIHHAPMWYRRPFFSQLSHEYSVEFIFTNVKSYDKLYGTKLSQYLPGMEGVNYKIVPKKLGIALGAIKRSISDYDVFVGGSWDTPSDLIETIFYYVIVKIRRKPFILWREDWDWNVNTTKRKIVKKIAGFISRGADAILVPGSKHRDFFTNLGNSNDKIFIMPNVSNITLHESDYQNKDHLIKELGLNNKKIVLFVGRLIDLKGIQYLLPAFQKLSHKMSDVVLLIVGDGEYREELEKIAHKLDLLDDDKNLNNSLTSENKSQLNENNTNNNVSKVIFTGKIENDLLGAYYLLANIFVLPSITTYYADACPLVVNEAMYFGKPVITSDAVGTTFMIENGKNGYVVPERDPDALYKAMDMILSDNKLEMQMGETSKGIIKSGFKYKDMMEGFQKALEYVKNKI